MSALAEALVISALSLSAAYAARQHLMRPTLYRARHGARNARV